MLIPKFYISKTKDVEGSMVTWNYAVSKHKLDDNYYLPSNFIDEGIDNNKHIELPYVLVGKYEAGSNGLTGSDEMLVSKSGLMPKVSININEARSMVTKYNDIEGVNGYQQYDIHVHDLLTMLFAIEFKTMNSQTIMRGFVDDSWENGAIETGGSDKIIASSGSLSNDGLSAFNYRGIENLWGNVWSFLEGIVADQVNDTKDSIYAIINSRYYSSNEITKYHIKLEEYKKLNFVGCVKESGFDSKLPFINLPVKIDGSLSKGIGDDYYSNAEEKIKIALIGGRFNQHSSVGLSFYDFNWDYTRSKSVVGSRIIKTPQEA